MNAEGQVVIHPAITRRAKKLDSFEAVRSAVEIKGTTKELMALLRPAD